MVKATSVALAAMSLFSSAMATQNIAIDGSNFITNSTGDRFSLIGVDYQPGGSAAFTGTSDVLSDAETCLRDAIILQKLGVNVIRVYNLSPSLDHNECVSIFNAAGIYLLLDVNTGLYGQYIDRTDPSGTYTEAYLEHVFGMIEAFAPFPNLLGFFAGNEIINQDSVWDAPLYIRAVVRDMKEYIANNIDRTIGVGYSAADVSDLLVDTYNYLECTLSNSTYSNIDFFGLNDYEWCGDSSYTESGYDTLVTMFEDTDIPIFFSEYGCNTVEPRTFTEVAALYGDLMTTLSGGLVYEYSEESDDYGLVDINSTTELTLLEDFTYLDTQFADIDLTLLTTANKTAEARSASACSAALVTGTDFIDAWDLPTRPSGANALVSSGISSSNPGSLVTVTATTMPATVYNAALAVQTGYKLVILSADDSNYPGLIDNYTSTGESQTTSSDSGADDGGSSDSSSSGTSTATSSASSSTSTKKSAASVSVSQRGVAATMVVALFTALFFL